MSASTQYSYKWFVSVFEKLGADDPEGLARGEVEQGVSQLGRYLFLHQAWRKVVSKEGNAAYVESFRNHSGVNEREPGGAIGPIIKRMLSAGVSPEDIAELLRITEWQSLFGFCYLLADPGIDIPELKHLHWRLQLRDFNTGEDLGDICLLHESVLETDPTGREMFPREAKD